MSQVRKEVCTWCSKEFETKDLYWDSEIIDEYGDEDNVWCCRECFKKHTYTNAGWVAPEGRGF